MYHTRQQREGTKVEIKAHSVTRCVSMDAQHVLHKTPTESSVNEPRMRPRRSIASRVASQHRLLRHQDMRDFGANLTRDVGCASRVSRLRSTHPAPVPEAPPQQQEVVQLVRQSAPRRQIT